MADEAGIDFLLPIGRWKGYGGDTGYQEATLETITWACGLLAATKRITVFGTVHAPLFHPVIAAKQMVTADHIGEGRFGLNIVVGWNEGEFEMFGVEQREHATRYEYAQEWIDAIKLMWSARDDFDFDGAFIKLKNVRAKPKPYGGTQPVIMNAGASPVGRAFAVRNCDAFFMQSSRTSVEETAQQGGRREGRSRGTRPRHQRVHGRRHHLPADHEGGRGLSPPRRGRPGRLGRGRPDAGASQDHAADQCRWRNSCGCAARWRMATAVCRSSAIRTISRGS